MEYSLDLLFVLDRVCLEAGSEVAGADRAPEEENYHEFWTYPAGLPRVPRILPIDPAVFPPHRAFRL